jgi:hypothetical protein
MSTDGLPTARCRVRYPCTRTEIGLAHQPLDAMLTAGFAGFAEIEEDARSSVDAMARDIRGANETEQPDVFLRAI